MDIVPLAGMLLSLLMVLIIAGSILMFPVMRRLGRLLELRIEERRGGSLPAAAVEEVEELKELVRGLEAQVERLAERQTFTERLLTDGAPRSGREGGA
jgi:hypothetical protein